MDIKTFFFRRLQEQTGLLEIPSFSMIFKDGLLIAEGHNNVEELQDISAHSEIQSIRQAEKHLQSRYLNDCILVTTLEPCTMCAGAIILARISEVIYFAPASKYDGISSMTPEQIYLKNHFPKLTLEHDLKATGQLKSFFSDKR